MGNKPSFGITYTITGSDATATYNTIVNALKTNASLTDRFTLEQSDDGKLFIGAYFLTPGCRYMDAMSFTVQPGADASSCTVVTMSSSTNVCPSWCGIVRACYSWYAYHISK